MYERVITAGFDILEGNQNTKAKDDLKYLVELIEESNGLKVSPAALQRVLLSIATLQWFLCTIYIIATADHIIIPQL